MDTLVRMVYRGKSWIYLMTRLYTFGCSFTNYNWPTWADILGRSYDYYENWGMPGAGNFFIYNSIIECILTNKLTSSDQVIVMWTSTAREDRYINNEWNGTGGLYINNQQIDYKGYLIRDLSFIYGAEQVLKQAGIPYVFLSMVPIDSADEFGNSLINDVTDVLNLYKKTIEQIKPSIYEIIFNCNWFSKPKCKLDQTSIDSVKELMTTRQKLKNLVKQHNFVDPHALPCDHMEYLEKVLPDHSISTSTREWVNTITKDLLADKNINWQPTLVKRI